MLKQTRCLVWQRAFFVPWFFLEYLLTAGALAL